MPQTWTSCNLQGQFQLSRTQNNSPFLTTTATRHHSSTAPFPPNTSSIPIRTWPRHTFEKFCRSESSLTSPRYLSKTWPFPTDATSPSFVVCSFRLMRIMNRDFACSITCFWRTSRQVSLLSISFHPNQNYMEAMIPCNSEFFPGLCHSKPCIFSDHVYGYFHPRT